MQIFTQKGVIIQHALIECLVCAKDNFRCWQCNGKKKKRQNFFLYGILLLERQEILK